MGIYSITLLLQQHQSEINVKKHLCPNVQALKYGTRTVELGSQADRAVELLEKGANRLNQLEVTPKAA